MSKFSQHVNSRGEHYRLTLANAVMAHGFDTLRSFCGWYDIDYSAMVHALSGRSPMLTRDGDPSELAERLMCILNKTYLDIFPEDRDAYESIESSIPDTKEGVRFEAMLYQGYSEEIDVDAYVLNTQRTCAVEKLIANLKPRERYVIESRYTFDGPSKSLDEIGEPLNVTRERVRQIEAKALRKMRHPSRSDNVIEFMNWYDAESVSFPTRDEYVAWFCSYMNSAKTYEDIENAVLVLLNCRDVLNVELWEFGRADQEGGLEARRIIHWMASQNLLQFMSDTTVAAYFPSLEIVIGRDSITKERVDALSRRIKKGIRKVKEAAAEREHRRALRQERRVASLGLSYRQTAFVG